VHTASQARSHGVKCLPKFFVPRKICFKTKILPH